MSFKLHEITTPRPTETPAAVDTSKFPDIPNQPNSIADSGLTMGFLTDLILKIVYFTGAITGQRLEEVTKLPFLGIIDKALEFLKLEEFVDIIGSEGGGFSERSFQYVIANKGRAKILEILSRSQYAGPAPVPFDQYIAILKRQSIGEMVIDQAKIRQAFSHLVVSDKMLDKIGPAANSARSLFLYGPPGNGKTTIAEGIANLLGGYILIPYAVEIDGQIIKIFDPLNHQVVQQNQVGHNEVAAAFPGAPARPTGSTFPDARWLVCKRPQVVVGGELILEQLELIFDPVVKIYEAPFQLKANGGLFLIDDFGRQKCSPKDLLNRWIVPLEKKFDYLALQTGKKLQVPFDVLIVFSTNLDPKQLVDDAFLRRIRHKIEVPNPSPAEFRSIFQLVCKGKKIPYSDEGLRHLIQEHYMKAGRDLRSCHPRDLCDQILDEAKYRGIEPSMSKELIDRACEAYFVKLG
ncbi:AAA ATPase central domain protein [Oscillochloris trichoides DG-6]|uniref:AAA ATPase central domain protein n=1 Tax=Oscillochloris trichoides DG-6 TaxID=765420 RepID=E1IA10_9CHLR|nr:AAA family ATPase [Oscillochloris trichoides]EFO82012.1 AAA ATPase central domain protein [Oscillochloris trichoides DG-6]